MVQLSNTPAQETPLALEARKSFSLALLVKTLDIDTNRDDVDLTGCTVTFVLAQPTRKGGAVLINQAFELRYPEKGYVRLDLQAADLDLAAGDYPYTVTLLTAEGYSSVLVKGEVEIQTNTDPAKTNEFDGVNPPIGLTATLSQSNQVTVRVNAVSASDLEIGTVTAAGPGQPATASIDGGYPRQVLNLRLPYAVTVNQLQPIGLDPDGVPYFDITLPFGEGQPLLMDGDGTPYFGAGPTSETPAAERRLVTEAALEAELTVKTPLSLRSYATGNGTANDTAGVVAWVAALISQKRVGYIPPGTYMVTPDVVSATLSGIIIEGAGDRSAIFKARSAGTRLLDFRQSGLSTFKDFAVDGNNLAATCLDLGNSAIGASTGNSLHRVRPLNQLDRGIDLSNNGDTVADEIHGGPWPDSATGIYWPNQGGNNLLVNPKLFPAAANPGPGRASVEASFQNMDVQGGALMGLRVLDNSSSQTLRAAGVQFYAIKDGYNVCGPKAGGGLYSFVADGATKFAVVTSAQCYFDGQFQFLLAAKGSTFNSGCVSGVPNAFASTFSGSNGTAKLRLKIEGCVLRNEAGANQAVWNDSVSTNVEVDYQNFFGATTRNYQGVVRAGMGGAGSLTGLQVGGGVLIRSIISSPLTPSAWGADQVIASGANISTTTTMSGAAQSNGLIVECAAFLPAGVTARAKIASTGNVRLEVYNNSASSYTLPGGTAFRTYALQL